jgi:hypothetical protein
MAPKRPDRIEFKDMTPEEARSGAMILRRRVEDLRALPVESMTHDDPRVENLQGRIKRAIADVFGAASAEYKEHQYFSLTTGPMRVGMSNLEHHARLRAGVPRAVALLEGMADDLDEKTEHATGPRIASGGAVAPWVFISHSTKDSAAAKAVVELLRAALNIPVDKIRCTSLAGYGLDGGDKLDAVLPGEVRNSKVVIGLLSESALASTFTMFEQGARWESGRPLIPLVPAGTPQTVLQAPISNLVCLFAERDADVHRLVAQTAKALDISPQPTDAWLGAVHSVTVTRAARKDVQLVWIATYGSNGYEEQVARAAAVNPDVLGRLLTPVPAGLDPRVEFRKKLNQHLSGTLDQVRRGLPLLGSRVDEDVLAFAWEEAAKAAQ